MRFKITTQGGDGADRLHMNFTAQRFPNGKWGFCWGRVGRFWYEV